MKILHKVAFGVLMLGALSYSGDWIIQGNIIEDTLGKLGQIYISIFQLLVGVSAIYFAITHNGDCKICGKM